LLTFFASKGIATYGRIFSIDGKDTLDASHDGPLVVMNGAAATTATVTQVQAFVQEVWNLPTPTGLTRYYPGILDLLALLVLGGQYRVY
jgi:endo-1,4-beta-D-glucanase Y